MDILLVVTWFNVKGFQLGWSVHIQLPVQLTTS